MAIPRLEADLEIISKLKDNPRSDGLSSAAFRAKFDEAALLIKQFLNNTLIPELDNIVDVEALLGNILDNTLTADDKAARADVVGQKLIELSRLIAANTGALFASGVRSGDFVVTAGQNFHAIPVTANKVRVFGGAVIAQGNYLTFSTDTYTDVDVSGGIVGTFRNDLICARYSRTNEGVETKEIVLISGTQQTNEGTDPTYYTGNINTSGAVIRDVPLYRVKLEGLTLTLEAMFQVQPSLRDYVDSRHFIRTATLRADGWEGETAPYTQTVTVQGVTTNGGVHVTPIYNNTPDDAEAEEPDAQSEAADDSGTDEPGTGENPPAPTEHELDIAQKNACAAVSFARRGTNSITFICLEEKPDADIPIEVEVYL